MKHSSVHRAAANAGLERIFKKRAELAGRGPDPAPLGRRATERTGPLKVAYLVPRTGVGGGSRILFEHARRLTDLGVEVTLVAHWPKPDWHEVAGKFVQVPLGVDLCEGVSDADLIVAGFWDQILMAREAGIAPVVHFEQGGFHLFEDRGAESHEVALRHLQAADFHITVSHQAAAILQQRFGVTAEVIGNAIDPDTFFVEGESYRHPRPYMLCVGDEFNEFKGIPDAIETHERLREAGHDLDLVWVTPVPPHTLAGRADVTVVAPSQTDLAALYRGAALYLCASRYESFCLPVLEAMACGTPVVTTNTAGATEYSIHEDNALLVDVRNVDEMTAAASRVLLSEALAQTLVDGGLETAASFRWPDVAARTKALYDEWSSFELTVVDPDGWDVGFDGIEFENPADELTLRHRLARIDATEVAVPVVAEAFEGHRMARWEVVARRVRPGSERRTFRMYLPAATRGARWFGDPEAYALFRSGAIDQALVAFQGAHRRAATSEDSAVFARWIALCLIELERDLEARAVVMAEGRLNPDYPDLHYLGLIASQLTGRPYSPAEAVEAARTVRVGAAFDEWLVDPEQLIRSRTAVLEGAVAE